MLLPECPSHLRWGHKTICIPCSQREYERVVDDPEEFRMLLDQRIQDTPELFPPEIGRGYRMKDTYPSRKTGHKLRRIELRNRQCYLVRGFVAKPRRDAKPGILPPTRDRPARCASTHVPSRVALGDCSPRAPTDPDLPN